MLAILAAVMLTAAPQQDTVLLEDGGRLVGTVIEEGPEVIRIRLLDGTFRRLSRSEVSRIEYADGSVSVIAPREAPPARPPGAPPPPSYRPPPPPYPPPPAPAPRRPPPRYAPAPPAVAPPRWPAEPASPLYFSFGLAGAFPYGDIEKDVDIDRAFDPHLDIGLEGGLRVSRHLAVGLYLDLGFGDPGRETRDACRDVGIGCDASRTRFGLLLRYTFAPAARITPWLSAGTGLEWATVTSEAFDDEQFRYRGWEVLRLMGGVDLRQSPVFGVGLYGGLALGRYSRGRDALGDFDIERERFHTTITAGVRVTLMP